LLPLPNAAVSLVSLVRERALIAPDAPALLAPGRAPLVYVALIRQIDAAIADLAAAGFGRGDRLAVALPEGPELAAALVAVTGCATCVPLNPGLDAASCRVALEQLSVTALVSTATDTPSVHAAAALGLPLIRVVAEPDAPAGAFLFRTTPSRSSRPIEAPAHDDVVLVLHTSGTTAKPKAVPFTHRMLVAPALTRARQLDLTAADRCLCVRPLFTAGGMRRCLFPMLAVGGSVVCTPGLSGHSLVDWIEEFRPTYYSGAPPIHRALLDEVLRRGPVPTTSLRFILSASAALPASLCREVEARVGVPLLQGYGMTETGIIAQNRPGRSREGSVGLPAGNEFAILGESGAWLPAGETGEIVVRGPEVFTGYEHGVGDPQAFHDGWFRTGDLGYVDRDGFLFIVGRAKEVINRGGFKVSPAAVDAALLRHPDVQDAVTFAVPHPTLGEDVVTAVVVRTPAADASRELRDFAFGELAAFMVPSRIVLAQELPRSPAGKLDRALVAAQIEPRLRAPFVAPRDRREELVAGLFAEVLGVRVVGALDHFFERGGDSLRGGQLIGRVNSLLRVELEVALLFKRPTVAEFARMLADVPGGGVGAGLPPIAPALRTAYRPDDVDATSEVQGP
jgi:acyl-CoA synthetase (AMP-forming)/AMP-acid ligase II